MAEQKEKLQGLRAQYSFHKSTQPLGPALIQNSNRHNEISVQYISINASYGLEIGRGFCERHTEKERSQPLPSRS